MRAREGGCGRTLTIGSKTMRFVGDRTLKPGSSIQLRVPWPAELPDGTRLNLMLAGRFKRAGPAFVEVHMGPIRVENPRITFRLRKRKVSMSMDG